MNGDLTSDTAISEAVSTALQQHGLTARNPIEVEMQGTTASLRGTVDSPQDKEMAERIARGVPGVVSVINELVVGDNEGGIFGIGRSSATDTEAINAPVVAPLAGASMSGSGAGGMAGTGFGPAIIASTETTATDTTAGTTRDTESDNITG